jgi:cytochrome c peroxidase
MNRFLISLGCVALIGAATIEDPLLSRAQGVFGAIPDAPPPIEGTVLTPATVDLGKMLYFDPRLSASHLLSCNTCHNVGLAGADLQETSTGHGWQRGPQNAPTVLNAAFNKAQFWDGRAPDLKEQAKGPIQAAVEMNNSPERVIETLGSIPEYVARFGAAFPDDEVPLSFDNVARAIEAFEATLVTPDAPFDHYLAGNTAALSEAQRDGLGLFLDKGCAACHAGVNLGGAGYFPFGLVRTPDEDIRPEADKGRYMVTRTESDKYVFRAPPLRNVALTYPYFHSGKVWELDEAVSVMATAQLGIELSPEQSRSISAFLESLTGRQPVVDYPLLPASTPDTPRPELGAATPGGH